MQCVSIHELRLESVLAEPLCDAEGRILLNAGTRLTPSLVRRLERWCISKIQVDDTPTATDAVEDSGLPECWDHQFATHESSHEMQTIHRALVQWESTRRRSPQA
ncbi:MAG: hypothetical protein AAF488_09945 [Planctomycetota bacterium]